MHIHSNLMNLSAMNPYSAAADQAISSAQKAASVRKKLTKAAAETSTSSTDETLMVANWSKTSHPQKLPEDEYHAGDSGKDSDFG